MMISFKELNITRQYLNALEDLGFEQATAIQIKAIPAIRSGQHVIGIAQTGTGKTFTISGVPKDPVLKGIMPRAFNYIFT